MKIIILFMSIYQLFTTQLDATMPYGEGEQLNVFAASGLNLRSEPHSGAEVLDLVRYGDVVMVLNTFDFCEDNAARIDYVEGHWILVDYQGIIGYLFDGYLSNLPFPSSKEQILDEGFDFAFTLGEYVDQNFVLQRHLDSTDFMQTYLLDTGIKVRRLIKDNEWTINIEIPNAKISDMLNVLRSMLPNKDARRYFDQQLVFIENALGYIYEVRLKEDERVVIRKKLNGGLVIKATTVIGC